jgi:hypothetical protein
VDNATISISEVSTFCQGNIPYARFKLLINTADKGFPGLIYVGAHSPERTKAEFYHGSYWDVWEEGMFPPNLILRDGLNDTALAIPLDRLTDKQGWRLYVGYGVLTVESEQKVQQMLQAYQIARAKLPDRQIPMVDPDHYRRTLVQTNMIDNMKYRYVLDWNKSLINMCTARR